MRLVIVGAGAIGGVVGGLLARAGREVLVVARGAQLAAIREHGLAVESPAGTVSVRPAVTEIGSPIAWRTGDVAVLAVKTQDVAAALGQLAAPAHVPLVCCTNGVEAERIALRHAAVVCGACVYVPATYLTPGVVSVWSAPVPGRIDVGRYPGGTDELADAIAGELRAAGFASDALADIMRWKRGKLLSNLANGAEALTGPEARRGELADLARREARACFAAAGLSCTTDAEDVERRVVLQAQAIAGTARAGGSTWQSFARGTAIESPGSAGARSAAARRGVSIETDYLNGEIALLGRLHGVPTPVNAALQRLAAEAARAGRAPGSMTLAELRAAIR